MGDPAEENDPPPESREFLTNSLECVNWKIEKNDDSKSNKDWFELISGICVTWVRRVG
jgi:hypothetical protein